jgi:hypothetical protein
MMFAIAVVQCADASSDSEQMVGPAIDAYNSAEWTRVWRKLCGR